MHLFVLFQEDSQENDGRRSVQPDREEKKTLTNMETPGRRRLGFFRGYQADPWQDEKQRLLDKESEKKREFGLVPADCDERNCTEADEGNNNTEAG